MPLLSYARLALVLSAFFLLIPVAQAAPIEFPSQSDPDVSSILSTEAFTAKLRGEQNNYKLHIPTTETIGGNALRYVSGKPYDFSLTFDGQVIVLSLSDISASGPVVYQITSTLPSTKPVNTIVMRSRGFTAPTQQRTVLDNLTFNGVSLGIVLDSDEALVMFPGATSPRQVAIYTGLSPFVLTGTMTLTWAGANPRGELGAQFWAGEAVPEASTALLAGLGLIVLGLAGRARRRTPAPIRRSTTAP
jgi:hypothetical protein